MLDKIQFAIFITYVVLTLALLIVHRFEEKKDSPKIASLMLYSLWMSAAGFIICLALLAELRLI